MDEQVFKQRTKKLALRVIELVEELPKRRSAEVIGRQLLRSATSVGANYRAACRGKSTADVLSKLAIVEEEGDETVLARAVSKPALFHNRNLLICSKRPTKLLQ